MDAEQIQEQAKADLDAAIKALSDGRAELAIEQRLYDQKVATLDQLKAGGLAQLQQDVVSESWTLYLLKQKVQIDLVVARKNAADKYALAMSNPGAILT